MKDRAYTIAFLEALIDGAAALEESIGHMESQIERAIQGLAAGGTDVTQKLEIIAERRKTQLERMFQLGQAREQIEELENQIQEHDEQERQVAQERENAVRTNEDCLDWLSPSQDMPVPNQSQDGQHLQREGENQMLEEMQREGQKPEDYLDWLQR